MTHVGLGVVIVCPVEARRVGFKVEGVADVARRRWRMVLRLGKYATIRVALFGT